MKYSSTSSLGLSGDAALMVVLSEAMGLLEVVEHAYAANHNVAANLVHVERRADGAQHQDRQLAAQVLAKLVETAQHAIWMTVRLEVLAELRRVDRHAQGRQERHDAPPVVFGQESGKVRVGRVERNADGHRLAVAETMIRELFQLVRRPVAEVERPGRAKLEGVA